MLGERPQTVSLRNAVGRPHSPNILTKRYGRTVHSWQSYLNAILNGRRLPNAEIVMAIDAWFAKN